MIELGLRHRKLAVAAQVEAIYSSSATIRDEQQADAGDRDESAVDGPLGLTGHEAAGEDVDSLEKPDASDEKAQDAQDV